MMTPDPRDPGDPGDLRMSSKNAYIAVKTDIFVTLAPPRTVPRALGLPGRPERLLGRPGGLLDELLASFLVTICRRRPTWAPSTKLGAIFGDGFPPEANVGT